MIKIAGTEDITVWRYMDFGRFVQLLHAKALWLSRGDLLGDSWEGAFSTAQLIELFGRVPPEDIGPGTKFPDRHAVLGSLRNFALSVPRCFYANCWTRRERESHLMWRAYCSSKEGVAIRTTFGVLRSSLPETVEVVPVSYQHGTDKTLDLIAVASQKRPAFEEEREVRVLIVDEKDPRTSAPNPPGRSVDWDPAMHIHQIRAHPQADATFIETLTAVVRAFAPNLVSVVQRSEMAQDPIEAFGPLIRTVMDAERSPGG